MKKNFFKQHVIFTSIISILICFIIAVLIGQLLGQALISGIGFDLTTIAGSYFATTIGKIIAIGAAFLLLLLSGLLHDIKAKHGYIKKGGWIIFLIMIAVSLYNIIGNGITNRDIAFSEFHFDALLACVTYAFVTAVLEELVCRVLLFQNMCQKWKNKTNGIMLSLIVSSIIFGACHLLNISAGLSVTLFQVFYAVIAGILFASLYLLSKNIWLCILAHFLIDFCSTVGYAFMPNDNAMALSSSMSSIDIGSICIVAFMTIGAVYALYLTRSKTGVLKNI